MMFHELRDLFLSNLRARVRNGEITERRLARLVGVSQPHIHNILKGMRVLTPDIGDRILAELNMSIFDLLDSYWKTPEKDAGHSALSRLSLIRVLDGRLGPAHPWPAKVGGMERMRVNLAQLAKMTAPVVVRLGADPAMAPLFGSDDCAILDQGVMVRTGIEPDGLYAIKWGRNGMLRKLKVEAQSLWLISMQDQDNPERWVAVSLAAVELIQIVRARASLLTPELDWPR
jgi:hypothetical protein